MAKKTIKNKLGDAVSTVVPKVEVVMPTKADKVREMEWRARDALSDIQRAEKHRSDSQLMKQVKQLAKQEQEALKKICK